MDYLPALRLRLTEPLAQEGSEGVPRVIQLMDDYDIIKDDYDNILEISKWPNSQDPLAHLDSKVWWLFGKWGGGAYEGGVVVEEGSWRWSGKEITGLFIQVQIFRQGIG